MVDSHDWITFCCGTRSKTNIFVFFRLESFQFKKTLTALFIGSCFVPVIASAAVDIYGRIHMSGDYYDNSSGSDAKDMISVNSNASRIGFRGGDELAHGLKAEWQIESGINLPTSGSLWASRNSFVGIVGDF